MAANVIGLVKWLKRRIWDRGLFSVRWSLAVWSCLGFANAYALRANLSVALLAMVNNTALGSQENSSGECKALGKKSQQHPHNEDGEFLWDRYTQGIILSAFFYGYLLTQIPGGLLADRLGAKKVFGYGILSTSILTLMVPFAASYGAIPLIMLRVLMGIGEGAAFPAMHSMWARWAPKAEMGKLTSFSYAGAAFGLIISLPVSGFLCRYVGWPYVFYIFGTTGCIWFLFWMMVAHDTPALHPTISAEERQYIENSVGKEVSSMKPVAVPWMEIIRSKAVWAIAVNGFCNAWGFYTLLTCLPQYMKSILKFRIAENSVVSMLPYIGSTIVALLAGPLADNLIKRNIFTTVVTRKLFNCLATFFPALFLFGIPAAGCDQFKVILYLCIAMTIKGLHSGSTGVNHMDIAPKFTGTIYGFTNMFANIAGIFSPYMVGVITRERSTMKEWSKVFYIASAMYIIACIYYLIFASGSLEPWAQVKEDPEMSEVVNEKLMNTDDMLIMDSLDSPVMKIVRSSSVATPYRTKKL